MIRFFKQGLSLRLFIFIYAVMVASFGIYTVNIIQRHSNDLMDSVELHSQRVIDCIKRSTRYGMLLNQKQDVQQIINNLSSEAGVSSIRIYNTDGVIAFSTFPHELNSQVTMESAVCTKCHNADKPIQAELLDNQMRIISDDGQRFLAVTQPIYNEPSCTTAPCHAHSAEQTVLGVMDVQMSLATVDQQIHESRRGTMASALYIILTVAFIAGFLIYFGVRKRIYKLIQGTREVASGNLDHKINIRGRDEVGQLARSFNKMTTDLKTARHENTEWSNSLEDKVEQKTLELRQAQEHIVRIEKLACLGKLSAVVAHEINNPLAGSLNYTVLATRILKKENLSTEHRNSLLKYLDIVKDEISRVGDIVKNMLIFAKQTGGNFEKETVHNLIESALMLIHHQMELGGIALEKELLCADDEIICDSGQIRQALVAILINAIEAMREDGVLTVRTTCDAEKFTIQIKDTGVGIPPENIKNIFDPFFSTKKEVKGVGLGLSVVYGIIERHKGKIWVDSEPGVGTIFNVELLKNPPVENEVNVIPPIRNE